MIELLILYVLNKNDNTLYGLKKEISAHYGEVSIPSHGALFPALKKLEAQGFVSVRKKLSDGGKKYTYYNINKNAIEYFNEKFMEFNNAKSETLENFLFWLKIRFIVIDMLDKNLLENFKERSHLKLEMYKNSILKKNENKYIELTELQIAIQKQYLSEIEVFDNLLNQI